MRTFSVSGRSEDMNLKYNLWYFLLFLFTALRIWSVFGIRPQLRGENLELLLTSALILNVSRQAIPSNKLK